MTTTLYTIARMTHTNERVYRTSKGTWVKDQYRAQVWASYELASAACVGEDWTVTVRF